MDNEQHIFTGCRNVQPEKLGKLDIRGNPAAEVPIAFWDADGEVHFPYINIREEGGLRAVLQNLWDDGNGSSGYYSLLNHAQRLKIQGSSQAVADLVAYV